MLIKYNKHCASIINGLTVTKWLLLTVQPKLESFSSLRELKYFPGNGVRVADLPGLSHGRWTLLSCVGVDMELACRVSRATHASQILFVSR
jgi:hypothetical protein